MIDLYVFCLCLCACALEAKSSVLRDHVCVPLERSLPFLRLASGRGALYLAAGVLAIDTRDSAQVVAGAAFGLVGLANMMLGLVVGRKLKRLRRAMPDEAEMQARFSDDVQQAGELAGLDAPRMQTFCAGYGLQFNRFEVQALFLALNQQRDGVISPGDIRAW